MYTVHCTTARRTHSVQSFEFVSSTGGNPERYEDQIIEYVLKHPNIRRT